MNTLIGLVTIAVLIILGALLGVTALALIVMFVLALAAAQTLVTREHRYLEEVGTPHPTRVATAGLVVFTSGSLMALAGPGLPGTGARVVVGLVLPFVAVGSLRKLWSLPGAGRSELALGATRDRAPRLVLAAAGLGVILLVIGVIVGVPGAGLPLIAATISACAYGWRSGGRRLVTVEMLRATVANTMRIADPVMVAVEPGRWLAGSDDVLATADAAMPRTWLPPAGTQAQAMLDELANVGWEGTLHPETRHLELERVEAVEPVPDVVPWDGLVLDEGRQVRLGVAAGNIEMTWDLDVAPHMLATGATGTGKTTVILGVVVQAASVGYRVWALDPKQSEFGLLEGRVERVARGNDECWETLIAAEQEMRDRTALLREHGSRHWRDVPGLQPLLVVVDEAFDLLAANPRDKDRKKLQDAAADALQSIAGVGRSAGVHMVVAAQRPDAKILSGALRNNLRCRLLLGRPLQAEALMVLDGVEVLPDVGDTPPRGRGLLQAASPSPPVVVQALYVTDEQLTATLPAAGEEPDAEPVPDAPPAAWEELAADDGEGGHVRLALDLDEDQAER